MTKRTRDFRKLHPDSDHRDGRHLLALCIVVVLIYAGLLQWWLG